jgi:hypothetical protein
MTASTATAATVYEYGEKSERVRVLQEKVQECESQLAAL